MTKKIFRLIPATLSACVACVFALGAHAGSITLDFNAVGDGAIVSDGTSSTGLYSGISISALNTGGGPNLAVAYDSGGTIGRDSDLEENRFGSRFTNGGTGATGVTGFGNLLVVQENSVGCSTGGSCAQPDDEAGGGFLRFGFDKVHILESFDYFDIDGSPDQQAESIAVKLFTTAGFDWSDSVDGTNVVLIDDLLSTGGDNTFRTHLLENPELVFGIEFQFSSSGAIDNLVLDTVLTAVEIPAPPVLGILLAAIFGLGIASRRQRLRAAA
ncbi:MAG: hypothetical protein ACI9JL_000501 [Paracoccaceae bacterium]|jgi:hypothetical protein